MYYVIDDIDDRYDIDGVLDFCYCDNDAFDDFDSYLDEEYGSIYIGKRFRASHILQNLDEDKYYEMYNEFVDGLRDESYDELLHLMPEDYVYINGYKIYKYDDDEEENEDLEEDQEYVIHINEENTCGEKVRNPEAFLTVDDEQFAWAKAHVAQNKTRTVDFEKIFGRQGI